MFWLSRVTRRRMEISAKAAYSPVRVLSELSKISSMLAWVTGLRVLEPLKMTSVIDSPRRFFAELSPITQRTASMMLDLPQPLGPTTAAMLLGKFTVVGSTKDLKPASLMDFRRMRGHSPTRQPGGQRGQRRTASYRSLRRNAGEREVLAIGQRGREFNTAAT